MVVTLGNPRIVFRHINYCTVTFHTTAILPGFILLFLFIELLLFLFIGLILFRYILISIPILSLDFLFGVLPPGILIPGIISPTTGQGGAQ